MTNPQDRVGLWPQFTIRTALVATAFAALILGWVSSMQRAERSQRALMLRAMRAEGQLLMDRSRARFQEFDGARYTTLPPRTLERVKLEGMNLRDITIAGGATAFYRASFNDSDLENATLSGGGSSFQRAQFNNARLIDARLTGGGSSFQLASFDNADLSGAVLTGSFGSFQGASFAAAKFQGTQFQGSEVAFHAVNIDGAQFQGADLTALKRGDLESCYFQTPPTYDAQTRFPEGFDPLLNSWKRSPGGNSSD